MDKKKKCIAIFFGKGKWLNKSRIPNLKEAVDKGNSLADNDLALVKVFLDEDDKAINGKDYYCDRCGLIISAKVDNCPRCNHSTILEGKPTFEWMLQGMLANKPER